MKTRQFKTAILVNLSLAVVAPLAINAHEAKATIRFVDAKTRTVVRIYEIDRELDQFTVYYVELAPGSKRPDSFDAWKEKGRGISVTYKRDKE